MSYKGLAILEKYFEKPDGEDCVNKVFHFTKFGTLGGLVYSTYNTMYVTKPKGYIPTLINYARCTSPCIMASITFATSACLLSRYIEPDDYTGYVVAGFLGGSIIPIKFRSIQASIVGGLVGAFWGTVMKDSIVNGWVWIENKPRKRSDVYAYEMDYTMGKSPKSN